MPLPITTAPSAPATTCTRRRCVAIELATGKYRWHFQQVHHDIWDYDAVNPVILMDVNVGGRTRKAIAEVGKTGWAYILDRETGKPLDRHRREAGAAGAAAGDRRDAAVPARRRRRAATDRDCAGRSRAGQRRPHLHAVRRQGRDDRRARHLGRRQLAAERLRSGAAAAVRLRLVGDQRLHRRRRREVRASDDRRRVPWRRHDVHARRAHRASSPRSM